MTGSFKPYVLKRKRKDRGDLITQVGCNGWRRGVESSTRIGLDMHRTEGNWLLHRLLGH